MDTTRVLLMGYGYWGVIVGRSIDSLADFSLEIIVEKDESRRIQAQTQFPNAQVVSDLDGLRLDGIDFGYIGTPPDQHLDCASKLLELGINVVIAKPMTLSVADDIKIGLLAKKHDLKVFCDFTYLFTPAITSMKSLIQSGEIGTPLFYASSRTNLGLVRDDCNAIWDLASHDFAIFQFLFDSKIIEVSARGTVTKPSNQLSTASISFEDSQTNSILGSVFVSWFSAEKVRSIVIAGSKGSIVFNDVAPVEKLFLIKGEVIEEGTQPDDLWRSMDYRIGEKQLINLGTEEALKIEFKQIAENLASQQTGRYSVDTESIAMHTTEVCVAADRSIESRCASVKVGM